MAKMTVLEIVQDILSDMNSDNVNSIADTEEALQVAQILKTTYYEIIDNGTWPHLQELATLDNLGDTNRPNILKLPDNVDKIKFLKYDRKEKETDPSDYTTIIYLEPLDFMDKISGRDSTASSIIEVPDIESGVKLLIRNDIAPSYYTSFDDEYLFFDSYNAAIDTTLQGSKSQIGAIRSPVFQLVDTYTPDLPSYAFSFLLAETKSTCFNTIKTIPNAKEEQKARRQRRKVSFNKDRSNNSAVIYPDYGRHK